MKKTLSLTLTALVMAAALPALALPKMDITQAKSALFKRQDTPTAAEFNSRRVRDLPSFDKLGIGNYYAEYRLDGGKTLMVWMYVASEPPLVDEVELYVAPAKTSEFTYQRALDLVKLVYAESKTGARVVTDFEGAPDHKSKNRFGLDHQTFEQKSLIPQSYDGALYYLGDSYGYKVEYRKGGLQVTIHRKDYLEKHIDEILKLKSYPEPKPTPTPAPTPTPGPTPHPKITW